MEPHSATSLSGIAAIGAPATLPLAAAGMAGVLLGIASMSPALGLFGPCVTRGSGRHAVGLTFDDGPVPGLTERLLDALGASHRATFFLLADRARAAPGLTRAIAARHQVALHGARHHPWLTLWSPARGADELRRARDHLEDLTQRQVTEFRPPFGAVSPRLFEAARRAQLRVVWGSVRSFDGGPAPDALVLRRAANARPGDLVILHDGRRRTADLLPTLLDRLSARGLRSAAVEELCPA